MLEPINLYASKIAERTMRTLAISLTHWVQDTNLLWWCWYRSSVCPLWTICTNKFIIRSIRSRGDPPNRVASRRETPPAAWHNTWCEMVDTFFYKQLLLPSPWRKIAYFPPKIRVECCLIVAYFFKPKFVVFSCLFFKKQKSLSLVLL